MIRSGVQAQATRGRCFARRKKTLCAFVHLKTFVKFTVCGDLEASSLSTQTIDL